MLKPILPISKILKSKLKTIILMINLKIRMQALSKIIIHPLWLQIYGSYTLMPLVSA